MIFQMVVPQAAGHVALNRFPHPHHQLFVHQYSFLNHGELNVANERLRQEAIGYFTAFKAEECIRVLNSALANLRAGFAGLNVKIRDNLDLMGDAIGQLTHHELNLLCWFMKYYQTPARAYYRLCGREGTETYCIEDGGFAFTLSSTAFVQRVPQNLPTYIRVPLVDSSSYSTVMEARC